MWTAREEIQMAKMSDEERERFLAEPRYGILSTIRSDGWPIGVPVWFDWNGETVRMFTSALSPKLKRLAGDPRASLVVVNHPSEEPAWVAFDGRVSVHEEGGLELAEALAPRYWDLSDPSRQETLALWREAAAVMRLLELRPVRIRSYKD
jgi:PPOX class probable F420-dependent enzyme